jgi:hypothetical protein
MVKGIIVHEVGGPEVISLSLSLSLHFLSFEILCGQLLRFLAYFNCSCSVEIVAVILL